MYSNLLKYIKFYLLDFLSICILHHICLSILSSSVLISIPVLQKTIGVDMLLLFAIN